MDAINRIEKSIKFKCHQFFRCFSLIDFVVMINESGNTTILKSKVREGAKPVSLSNCHNTNSIKFGKTNHLRAFLKISIK